MQVLARPALKGPCQLRGIVCSLSQGPWVTQSPWTAPSPWLTLWISAQTVSAGRGGHWTAPKFKFAPLITFLQPCRGLGRWLASPPLYRETRAYSAFPISRPAPPGCWLCVHGATCFRGPWGWELWIQGKRQGSPRPCRTSGHGSLDSRPPSDLTAAHPPPLSIPGHPGQLGGACTCVQIHPLGVWSGEYPGGASGKEPACQCKRRKR